MIAEPKLIRVCDVETTGIDDPAEMVEIGWTDVTLTETGWQVDPYGPRSRLVIPGIPISFPAMAVHHITEAMVEGAFTPAECRAIVATGADILCAHNAAFDARFVRNHDLPWICTFKAARTIWPHLQGHGNGSIRYERGLCPHDARALPSHRAGPDTWVTAHILLDLLKETTVERLIEIAENPVLLRKVGFGEHVGKLWSDVPDGYLDWILNKSKMPSEPDKEDVVFTARCEVKRREAKVAAVQELLSDDGAQPDLLTSPQQPDAECRKGGRRAQKAAMICAERGFWTFTYEKFDRQIESAESAATWLREHCGVTSRAHLDHLDMAAARFDDIDKRYRLWLEGFD